LVIKKEKGGNLRILGNRLGEITDMDGLHLAIHAEYAKGLSILFPKLVRDWIIIILASQSELVLHLDGYRLIKSI
jgi:hypothetical protein